MAAESTAFAISRPRRAQRRRSRGGQRLGARLTDSRARRKASGRRCAVRADPPGLRQRCRKCMRPQIPGLSPGGLGPHHTVLRFPLRAFLRFPGCPPGSSPSSAFLWFPFVQRPPVRSLRPLPGSGSPSVSLRVPFPLSNLHVSAAAARFRRRWSRAAGTKVISSAATTSPGSRDPPALQMGSAWARWDLATGSPVTSGRRAHDSPHPNRASRRGGISPPAALRTGRSR